MTTALQALSSAALLLPGLVHAAEPNQALSFQYSRYEENNRKLNGVDSGFKPLQVDTVRGSGFLKDGNGLTFDFAVAQDSWSGATPVASALTVAQPNRPVLRNTPEGVVISGATPIVNATIDLDDSLRPLRGAVVDESKVLVMSSASPEIRKQADFSLTRESGALNLTLGAGISDEPDYLSRFWNMGASVDFDEQHSTLSFGFAHTANAIDALLDEDFLPYLDRKSQSDKLLRAANSEILHGSSRETAMVLGFTRVLNQASWLEVSAGYAAQTGYLANPYKAVTVVFADASTGKGDIRALMEQRPDHRNQHSASLHYALSLDAVDAAMHLDYQYASDNWNLASHSIDLAWVQQFGSWQLTPHLRYYTQGAADFYKPVLVTQQPYRQRARDASGREIWRPVGSSAPDYLRTTQGNFLDVSGNTVDATLLNLQPLLQDYDPAMLPAYYSGDHRLAGFGSLNTGLTFSRRFAAGFRLEASWDYYRRRSAWQLDADEDSTFADFSFGHFNVGISLDLEAASRRQRRESAGMNMGAMDHSAGDMGMMHAAPSGLMYSHAPAAGAFMSAYRTRYQRMAGSILQGSTPASDSTVVSQACPATDGCRYAADNMSMQMHMVSLMYGLTPRFSLMLMPQFMSMDMQLRELQGSPPLITGTHEHGVDGHRSSTLGDTLLAGTWQLGQFYVFNLQTSLGISMPTGKTDLAFRRVFGSDGGLLHFGMQTGSGTWDFMPSLTITSENADWQYGLQLNAVKRLQDSNDSGYRLGNETLMSAWLSHALNEQMALVARLSHSNRSAIKGDYNRYNGKVGPMDFPANQGGRLTELGLGLNFMLPGSSMLGVEWQVPVQQAVNGTQLENDYALNASWHYGF